MRVRDESLLLPDSLEHMASFVDGIVVFDDASSDDSVSIARAHPAVIEVIVNKHWRSHDRPWEETANRRFLASRAARYSPEWFFYADADERFDGDPRAVLTALTSTTVVGVRVDLFDAYMTPTDHEPFVQGRKLMDFRVSFGVERRRILMAWKRESGADYRRSDSREPDGLVGDVAGGISCQHYGKSLSVEQWEETCRYYIDNFPGYADKWRARLGGGIHTVSDFGTPLRPWAEVQHHAIDI